MLFENLANPIERILKYTQIKKVLVFVLLLLMASSVGGRLLIISSGFTLGSLMRTCLFPFLYLLPIAMLCMTNSSLLNLPALIFKRPNINTKQILLISCISLLISSIVPFAGSNIAMTTNLITILVIVSYLLSIFLSIRYDIFYGIIGFILTFPFLSFLQRELSSKEGFSLGAIVLTPSIIFILTLVLISVLSYFVHGKIKVGIPMYKTIGIYLVVFFASVVTSTNLQHSLKIYLLEIIYPVLFFFLVATNVKTDKEIRLLLYSLIVSAILFSFFDYYFVTGGSITYISELSVLHGNYFLGGERELFLILTIPLALSLAATSPRGLRLVLFTSGLIMIFFVLFSHTRSAIVTMFVSLSIFSRNKRIAILILSLTILAAIFWDWTLPNILIRFQEFTTLESLHPLRWSPMRYHAWLAAIDIIKDYPIHGIGYGMWDEYYYKYGPSFIYNIPGFGLSRVWIGAAHNAFLDVASQTGIPGLIAWLFLIGTISKEGLCVFRCSADKIRKTLALGCISGIVAFWVICFCGGYPSFTADRRFGTGMAFWTMVSIIFAIKQLELNNPH